MVDNIAVTPGTGATIATDEITWGGATVHAPLGKLIIGADGAAETLSRGSQTAANSLPVVLASDQVATVTLATAAMPLAIPTVAIVTASFGMVYNGATFDRVQTGASDATGSNGKIPSTLFAFNGATFDRLRTASADTLAITGILASAQFLWNGSSFDRPRAILPADSTSQPTIGVASATAFSMLWNSATWDRQPGNASEGAFVSPKASATGGASAVKYISAASTNANYPKASPGKLYSVIAINTNAALRFLKIYNKASGLAVGTDVPVMTIPLPGNAAGAGVVFSLSTGVQFSAGIAIALTTGMADTDTAAVAANEIVVNIIYA